MQKAKADVMTKNRRKINSSPEDESGAVKKARDCRAADPASKAASPSPSSKSLHPADISYIKSRAEKIVDALEKVYPDAQCSLVYEKPYELLISVRLSAQCTDARVNIVTKELFQKYPTLESFANARLADVEEIVRPCGLYHTKAKSIIELSQKLLSDFGGRVPDKMEELLSLPGVGRKTANLILGDVYKQPAVVTDTHCIRICRRLGLSEGDDPAKGETKLREILPMERASDFCHRLVQFGRDTCTARKPKCAACPLSEWCEGEPASSNGSPLTF